MPTQETKAFAGASKALREQAEEMIRKAEALEEAETPKEKKEALTEAMPLLQALKISLEEGRADIDTIIGGVNKTNKILKGDDEILAVVHVNSRQYNQLLYLVAASAVLSACGFLAVLVLH